MARTRYTADEIICHLQTVEIEAGKVLGSQTPVGSSASSSRRTMGGRKNTAASAASKPNG
jgi:hypothetical protein